MVRKFVTALFMTASLITLPTLVGCDRTVSKTETVTDGPRGTTVKKDEVTKKADGTVEHSTETKRVP